MPKKQYTTHYIYKTTCKITGKFYVGMHSTFNLDDEYIGSGKRLWYSINKYGRENHTKVILEFCKNRIELKQREKEIVNEDFLKDKMCMNLIVGGEGGGGFTQKQQKINNKKSQEPQRILRETNPDWVKKKSEKMSKSRKLLYVTGKLKKKYFYDWTGKKHKKETIEKMKKSHEGQGIGKLNSQFGTHWINNEVINKKMKKSIEIPEGWKKGRI